MIRQILFDAKWKILLAAVVLIALRCVWLWQPERQVRLHQEHLLKAAEDRNWGRLSALIDDGFRTPTGRDKTWALQQAGMVLQQFMGLEIKASDTSISMEGDSGRVTTRLRIEGTGMELAEMAKDAVNKSGDPFEFTWRHVSWKPWDWQLTEVDHPLLRLNADNVNF